MSEIRKNTWTWMVLIILTLLSAALAENSIESMVYLIVLVSGVKFLLVIFQFVEIKNAHKFWSVIGFLFVGIYLFGVIILYL